MNHLSTQAPKLRRAPVWGEVRIWKPIHRQTEAQKDGYIASPNQEGKSILGKFVALSSDGPSNSIYIREPAPMCGHGVLSIDESPMNDNQALEQNLSIHGQPQNLTNPRFFRRVKDPNDSFDDDPSDAKSFSSSSSNISNVGTSRQNQRLDDIIEGNGLLIPHIFESNDMVPSSLPEDVLACSSEEAQDTIPALVEAVDLEATPVPAKLLV